MRRPGKRKLGLALWMCAPSMWGFQTYSLPELSYDYKALEPYISGKIMELHHSKRHINHAISWKNLTSKSQGGSEGCLASAIATKYGSLKKLVAKKADIQVAKDLSNFGFMWTYCSRFMNLLSSQKIDLCFANEDEAEELMRGYHNSNFEERLVFLANYYSSVVVRLGSKDAWLLTR
ncbi:hypothetical protein L7F22_059375 [Adiantum nelumboides]|nr:hypothetical protein [Adiantum nelumboides]